jgi:hypothetical protein
MSRLISNFNARKHVLKNSFPISHYSELCEIFCKHEECIGNTLLLFYNSSDAQVLKTIIFRKPIGCNISEATM